MLSAQHPPLPSVPTRSRRYRHPTVLAGLLPLWGLTLIAHAQTLVLKDPKLDAGVVQKGTIIRKEFVVRNTGTTDLRILDVKPKCGCMTATFDKTIKPGSGGKISVAVETKAFQGPILKVADVLSNDPVMPSTTITLAADVKALVSVLPSGFLRILAEAGTPATQDVTLSSDSPTFKPSKVTTPRPYLKASLTPGSTPTQRTLSVTCDSSAPEGLLGGYVSVQTGVPEQPELSIAISGYVRPKGAQKGSPAAAPASGPRMTNQDVIEMVSGGLSDDIVATSIKQASAADFDTTPTGLLALKKSHVSDAVILAMQNKKATPQAPPAAPPQARESSASATPCADVDYLGVIQAVTGGGEMAGTNAYGGRVRNRASYTKEVDFSWNMNGRAETGTFRVPAGQFIDVNLGQGPAPPTNVRVVACR